MAEVKIPAELEEIINKELDSLFEKAVIPVQEYGPITDIPSGVHLSGKKKVPKGANPLEDPILDPQSKKLLRSRIGMLLSNLAQHQKNGDDKWARKTRNMLRRLGWYINTHGKELPPEIMDVDYGKAEATMMDKMETIIGKVNPEQKAGMEEIKKYLKEKGY